MTQPQQELERALDDRQALRKDAGQVLAAADLLYPAAEVEQAIERMAGEITAVLRDKNPLVLCPMIGAMVFAGRLLPRLDFLLEVAYIHATRYRGETTGGELHWIHKPATVTGRTLLVVDDILDEGNTMRAIVEECRRAGAAGIYTAVLADKQIDRPKEFPRADFTGLAVPNRYVFGYGMDYKGYLRNCAGIYAVKDN
ncbi:MAG: hypoxanthine-guanine phosphoribosyltransferase [Gammaproteobacteria bacterium]|nr:MAG: hypoxanthine-guanine phosphoribosyltransferase [Gammaproteobacteria bacterium]